MTEKYDTLKLENQLCFPLYACSKEVIKRYKPLLDQLDLTYTQYIAMLVLWDKKEINVKSLGEALFLDSGTLTPVLKKLEQKNYIIRERLKSDERNLLIKITKEGEHLKEKATKVPGEIVQCINLDFDDAILLHQLLNKMLQNMDCK